jgi:hypothetical protein
MLNSYSANINYIDPPQKWNDNSHLVSDIVTVYKMWNYLFDPETKCHAFRSLLTTLSPVSV